LFKLAKDTDLKLRSDMARMVAGKDNNLPAVLQMLRTDPLPLLVALKDKKRPALIQSLRTNPLELSFTLDTKRFAEELELFTTDYYPEVRREACAALERVFPARRLPAACGGISPAGRAGASDANPPPR
jgi:HEAT repeat protein